MVQAEPQRRSAFGSGKRLTPIDRLGVWLSSRSVCKSVGTFAGRRVADLGCGYEASLTRRILQDIESAILVDVSLADDLKSHPKITALEASLPQALCELPSASIDVVMCISSLEHLAEPDALLAECHRLIAPGGLLLVNVPSWLGKRFLELSAFRLGLSPAEEMDDHKMYYDPKDLWPHLRRAGFLPHNIRCHRHKGGLNVFAVCRVESSES